MSSEQVKQSVLDDAENETMESLEASATIYDEAVMRTRHYEWHQVFADKYELNYRYYTSDDEYYILSVSTTPGVVNPVTVSRCFMDGKIKRAIMIAPCRTLQDGMEIVAADLMKKNAPELLEPNAGEDNGR